MNRWHFMMSCRLNDRRIKTRLKKLISILQRNIILTLKEGMKLLLSRFLRHILYFLSKKKSWNMTLKSGTGLRRICTGTSSSKRIEKSRKKNWMSRSLFVKNESKLSEIITYTRKKSEIKSECLRSWTCLFLKIQSNHLKLTNGLKSIRRKSEKS